MSTAPRPRVVGVALSDLIESSTCELVGESSVNVVVTGITHDSRSVQPGDVYAALPGFNTHGAEYVRQAQAAGAIAIFTDSDGIDRSRVTGLPIFVADDPRALLGALAAEVYGHPSRDLIVVGITGTNGKTTTSYLVDAAFREAGMSTGVIGTVGTRIGDELVPTTRTTPESTDVHALLALMRERGVQAVSMEVSSHALRLGRVDGVTFAAVGFTNLSEDHLDFHDDMDDYFEAKATLFLAHGAPFAAICVDDEWGVSLAARSVAAGLEVTTFGMSPDAQVHPEHVASLPGGSQVTTIDSHGNQFAFNVHLPGTFNVANALGAFTLATGVGVDPEIAARGISACGGVPGRMERVLDPDPERGLVVLVDYAHTPDAVDRAVSAAREGVSGRTIVVLGAGGDRDRAKRPHMGQAAAQQADVVIITDDNPRSEVPADIRAAVLAGAQTVASTIAVEVADRREAIAHAVGIAKVGDVVLVLGKGHEQGQEVDGVINPFDDRIVVAESLKAIGGHDFSTMEQHE
ncbi:MAG: UDP-N-acetylmuramoyl-L-alanyl-D-glutamate--2,6-diaminopimelate ligase [Actinomycetes bacterium]